MALINDTFTDSNFKALQNHTPNQGGAWEKLSFDVNGLSSTVDAEIDLNNRLAGDRGVTDGHSCVYRNAIAPSDADYDVYVQYVMGEGVVNSDAACIAGRMSSVGSANGEVDRYEVRVFWWGSPLVELYKIVGGVRSGLDTRETLPSQNGWVRLEMIGTSINVYHRTSAKSDPWSLIISAVDSAISQAGRAGLGAAPFRGQLNVTTGIYLDNFVVDGNFVAKTGADSTQVTGTEASTLKVTVLKTGSDSTQITGTDAVDTQDILVLKTGSDSTQLTGAEGTPTLIQRSSLAVRAGLATDVEPYFLLTYWEASEWAALGKLLTAKASGTILDWVNDSAASRIGLDVTVLDDDPFDPLLGAHPGSLFASAKEQRSSLRLFVVAQLIEGGAGALRATVKTPYTTLALTQDPPSHEAALSGGYRRMPVGIFSWPPVGSGTKYRAGQVSQGVAATDPDSLLLLQIEGLSEDAASKAHLRINSIDLLPVTDGYFALVPSKLSEQSALQQGEILVVDSIDGGGYVVKPTEKPATLQENVHMPSTTIAPVLGSGFYLQPKVANCITILGDRWSGTDDLGESKDEIVFNAWVEYEPRYLYL